MREGACARDVRVCVISRVLVAMPDFYWYKLLKESKTTLFCFESNDLLLIVLSFGIKQIR